MIENKNNLLNNPLDLEKLLALSKKHDNINKKKNIVITEEMIKNQMTNLRDLIAFFREYPDIFVDMLKENDPNCSFKFYYYQRIFLRVAMRHRYVYATFPRAYSKSFLSMMILMIRCILYPNSHLFVTTGGKERSYLLCIIEK